MGPLGIGASGVRSAELRMAASAHNVANWLTPDFRPLRTTQAALEGGGSQASLHREPSSREVDLAHEFVEQARASVQFKASLRCIEVAADMRGHLIDLLA